MSKQNLSRQEVISERERAFERVRPLIGGRFYTLTEYTRSQTDYVRVFVVEDGSIREVTYYVARMLERRLTDRGIPMKGGGYSKALDVVDAAHRTLGVKLDQKDWQEL